MITYTFHLQIKNNHLEFFFKALIKLVKTLQFLFLCKLFNITAFLKKKMHQFLTLLLVLAHIDK